MTPTSAQLTESERARQELGCCEFSFQPNPELVSVVRRFLAEFYERMLQDRETVARIGLAAHELLENAIKYAQTGETRIGVRIWTEGHHAFVTICTENRASHENVEAVKQAVEEVQSAADPFVHYLDMMHRSSKLVHGSGLGLARIRAEAEMDVGCALGEHDKLTISAETAVPYR